MEEHGFAYDSDVSISTKNFRGIGSFFQHLPVTPYMSDLKEWCAFAKSQGKEIIESEARQSIELYSVEFDSQETRNRLATDNLILEYLNYQNTPVIAFMTIEHVKKGDQLGLDYRHQYWLSRKVTPEFFDKNGSVLPSGFYKRTFGCLTFEIGMNTFTYTGEYKPLVDLLKKRISPVTVTGDDNKTYKVSVGSLFLTLVAARACTFNLDLYDKLAERAVSPLKGPK